MATFSNAASVSDAVTIASLSTLGAASYSAPSTLVDNTPANARSLSYLRGLLRLTVPGAGSGVTTSGSAPFLTLFRLIAADGTTLPNPPGAAASAPAPNTLQTPVQLISAASYSVVDFGPFDLDPFQYGFQIYNNSGVAFSGSCTAILYRWNITGV